MNPELPDPVSVRIDPCPEGYTYQWVPEAVFGWLAWRIVDPADARRCRFASGPHRCDQMSVAKLNRGRKTEQWWHYCTDHLYGRAISGRRVWVVHTIAESGAQA